MSDVLKDPSAYLDQPLLVCGRQVDEFETCRLEGRAPAEIHDDAGRALTPVTQGLELAGAGSSCHYGGATGEERRDAMVQAEGKLARGGLAYVFEATAVSPYEGTCPLDVVLMKPRR
ncbi:hypothetical protein [Stenotrophomonas panacihumi]|uniref:hypothetical protein n=1 Tax=Stenotrophomonas panacihumi TaxID=676599 RepID=UPI00070C0322|nr:hypothetical protein [Stenotrophomonas panacihumi]PTN54772.1 hypothetical protein C9J98_08740 [Stenotrophomonas panacihumi]